MIDISQTLGINEERISYFSDNNYEIILADAAAPFHNVRSLSYRKRKAAAIIKIATKYRLTVLNNLGLSLRKTKIYKGKNGKIRTIRYYKARDIINSKNNIAFLLSEFSSEKIKTMKKAIQEFDALARYDFLSLNEKQELNLSTQFLPLIKAIAEKDLKYIAVEKGLISLNRALVSLWYSYPQAKAVVLRINLAKLKKRLEASNPDGHEKTFLTELRHDLETLQVSKNQKIMKISCFPPPPEIDSGHLNALSHGSSARNFFAYIISPIFFGRDDSSSFPVATIKADGLNHPIFCKWFKIPLFAIESFGLSYKIGKYTPGVDHGKIYQGPDYLTFQSKLKEYLEQCRKLKFSLACPD